MKIGIYALAKNEAHNVGRWEASCREADYRVVTDTGSTDGTPEQLEASYVTVAHGCPIPWRWDDAHTLSLMHLPADVDVAIRLDLDETLDPGWREALEAAWQPDTTKLRYWYWWSRDLRFRCDRIHSRVGYRWTGATHEGLVRWDGAEVQTFCDTVTIRHHRDPDKVHKTDLSLLRQAVKEAPHDARMQWYLARELDYANDAAAADEYVKFMRMPGGAPTERSYSRRALARLDKESGKKHMMAAMLEAPDEPESFVSVAVQASRMGDSVGALYWARQALRCPDESRSHASDPEAYSDMPADIAYSAAWSLGLHDEALVHAREAARRNPSDPRHQSNIAVLETMKSEDGPRP